MEEFAQGPFHGARHFLYIEMHLRTTFLASAQESKASFIRGRLFNCGLDCPANGTAALNSVEWVVVAVCKKSLRHLTPKFQQEGEEQISLEWKRVLS